MASHQSGLRHLIVAVSILMTLTCDTVKLRVGRGRRGVGTMGPAAGVGGLQGGFLSVTRGRGARVVRPRPSSALSGFSSTCTD